MVREETPTLPVEHVEERLAKARLLVVDEPTREAAMELLDEVLRDASGTRYAREALELKRRYDAAPPWNEPDPELEAWRRRWSEIHGPDDGRLLGYLEDLRQAASALPSLAAEVEGDLRRWLDEQTRAMAKVRVEPDEAELDPRRLEAVAELADELAGFARFEVALRGELQRFRDERYGLRLRELSPAIRRACAQWSIDEAWRLLSMLDGPPETFRGEWQTLQDEVYAAETRRSEIEEAFGELPDDDPDPRSWAELRRLVEALRDVCERRLDDVPEAWRERLRRSEERVIAAARRWLEAEAGAARNLDGLAAFWEEYRHLKPERLDTRLELRAAWFEEPVARLAEALTPMVAAAADANELEAAAHGFDHDLASLPPPVREACSPWVAQLEKILGVWRAMERGERFTVPADDELAVPGLIPAAFSSQTDRFSAFLDDVDAGLHSLERPHADPAPALATARRILEEVPGHVEARRLENAAYTLELRSTLDAALASWDVETFLRQVEDPALPAPYRELRERASALAELAAQAEQPPLISTYEAAAWFRAWRAARRRLPSMLPPVLDAAVKRQETVRGGEWQRLLEELLKGTLDPGECRAVAGSLTEAVPALDFDPYRRKLERRERIGRVEEDLAAKRWDSAERKLADVPNDDEAYRRLDVTLALGRARTATVKTLARTLNRRWNDAVTYRGTEAYELLVYGLEEAWRLGKTDALRLLEEVARRAERGGEVSDEVLERLADWLEWLQVERRLASGVTASGLRRLVSYVESPAARDLGRRCRSLVDRWREDANSVALAWAWRALGHVEPPLFPEAADPVELLERETEAVIDEVTGLLRDRTDLEAGDLEGMERRLGDLAGAWRDLHDFLDLLPRLTDRPRSPARLEPMRTRVAEWLRTLRTVAELEESDLRRKGAASRWSGARRYLMEELERARRESYDLPLARALLARLEPLEPLTQLYFAESQIRRAAARCASAEPEDLDAEGLFAELAARVDALAEEIVKAGRTGGVMWEAVSRDYWTQVPVAAGDLEDPPSSAALPALADRCRTLQEDEDRFRETLRQLDDREPIVSARGAVVPERHRGYLDLYPTEPPLSRRVYLLFDRFARGADQRAILERSSNLLPSWISGYLKEGVP